MKKIMWILIIGASLISCINQGDSESESENGSAPQAGKNISTRDRSISPSNSYSDLFFDSSAMENFIAHRQLADSFANRIRSFYNTRNYQFAWFSSDGLTEQARGFWNLHDYVTTYDKDTSLKDKVLQKQMDALTSADSLTVNDKDKKILTTELTLTYHFIKYILRYYEKGYVKRKEMERFIPYKKQDPMKLADSLVNKKHKDDKYFEDVNPSYKGLKEELAKYVEIAKNGGWPEVHVSKKALKKGISAPEIAILKKRLEITGDLPAHDTSAVFNDSLEAAVKTFQQRHGNKATGVVSDSLAKEMNVPVEQRIEQILMNMDRMRWLARQQSGRMIVVNIPEFELHAYDGGKKVFDMDVVVGKEGHNTMMFNGDLNQVVYNPYWNVPSSIVQKEILPAMEKHPDYLQKQDMEITGKDEDGEPVIRQNPGPKNALGRVKFIFPNSFNIYLHDTPVKSLFEKDKRAYSHGCIRVKEPEKLAGFVLQDQPGWTPDKIEEAMNSKDQKSVKVKDPIPVVITYYTAWVDDQGQLNFRDDIYGHDKDLASKMFR